MVTFALFGERVDLHPIEGQDNWAAVRLEQDGYTGFIDPKLVDTSEKLWLHSTWTVCCLRPADPCGMGGADCDLPAGSRIPRVALPHQDNTPPADVVVAAQRFLGRPTCGEEEHPGHRLQWDPMGAPRNGHPRDASQQWAASKTTEPGGTMCSTATWSSSIRRAKRPSPMWGCAPRRLREVDRPSRIR